MAYVALKPVRFAGQDYKIGDVIPDGVVHPGAASNLVRMQVIVETAIDPESGAPTYEPIVIPDPTLEICVQTDEGELTLEPTDKGIRDIFTALLAKPAGAEQVIKEMDDADALILLHMADSRKAVKAAAEARAKELHQ